READPTTNQAPRAWASAPLPVGRGPAESRTPEPLADSAATPALTAAPPFTSRPGAGVLAASPASTSAARAALARTTTLQGSLAFEPNVGQAAPNVLYSARASGYSVLLTSNQAVLSLTRHVHPNKGENGEAQHSSISISLAGASARPQTRPLSRMNST